LTLIAPGDLAELSGTVRPALAGTTVQIERLTGQSWRVVGRATIDAAGAFTAQVDVTPGSYRARIPAPGRGLVSGTSSTLVVNQ
ncbi:hypothetical protein NVV43_25365, partial [Escherichia marmotae]|nr:hypothetical protein [Escherichia marmotae]